jgi:putative transposase
MPRRPRLDLAGVPQHIIQRGVNRSATFYADKDYRFYLRCLREAATKYGCSVYAYVLMTNHVHLLVSTSAPQGLSLMMQHIGRRFVRYVNDVYGRTGTLWEGRFKSQLVDSETYFFRCCCYIECNPVRAGMVLDPRDYVWSSYAAHAFGVQDDTVTVDEQYLALGQTAEARQLSYRALFVSPFDDRHIEEIRYTANRGWPLGGERFKDDIERALQQATRPRKRGRPSVVREMYLAYRVRSEKLH